LNFAKSGSEAITIHWRIDDWFKDIPEETRAKFKKYHEELLRLNKGINLISAKAIPVADAMYFADTIIATRFIQKDLKHKEVYDLGSGNGFPGIIMAIMMPNVKFHLVDFDAKKAEFLKHVIKELQLKNVDVLIRNVDVLPPASIQCAISRDFNTLTRSLLATRKVFAVGGIYYHMKGEEWATEIADIPSQLCSFWSPGLLGEYKLPVGEVRFAVVKTEKIQA